MSVIKIEHFGGEMPATSARALPPNAAQVNQNLHLGTNEFRPLLGLGSVDSDVSLMDFGATGGTIVRSLYRTGDTASWYASAHERSFARTPINDLGLTGRTYATSDNPTSPPIAFDGADLTTQRPLGVPAPPKPVTELIANDAMTVDTAWNALYMEAVSKVQAALRANTFKSAEPLDRFADEDGAGPAGITFYGGARSVGEMQIPWASGNPSLPAAFQDRWWQLFSVVTKTRAIGLGLNTGKLNGRLHTDDKWYFPIDALPYTYRATTTIKAAVKAELQAILQPLPTAEAVLTESTADDALPRMFSDEQIDAIIAHAENLLDVETHCRSQRDELTALVAEFEHLLKDAEEFFI